MRDTRLGEVLEAKMHLRICDLRVLCAATTLETARLVAHHGGEKVQAKPARGQMDRGRRVCRAEQGRSHGGAATDRNPVVAAVEAVIYGL